MTEGRIAVGLGRAITERNRTGSVSASERIPLKKKGSFCFFFQKEALLFFFAKKNQKTSFLLCTTNVVST
jgi:hypothetical protein